MKANLGAIYDTTITIINRLGAKDSLTKQDEYFKTVLSGCMWSLVTERTVAEDGSVTVGTTHRVQIPESTAYKPYNIWKEEHSGFTISNGDYIVKGIVTEEVTASTLKKIIPLYEPDAFQVQTFRDATKGEGFTHSETGIMRFAEPYIIEG